jgi:hypothetical protein
MTLRLVLYVACVALLLGAVALSPSWDQWLWLRTLHDFAHGPVFGAIAVLAMLALSHMPPTARGSASSHYFWAFGCAVFLGGLTELVQWRTGRDPSWIDFGTDVLGVATFLLLYSLFDSRLRRKGLREWGTLGALMGLAFMASPMIRTAHAYYERSRAFPQIIDIHRGLSSYFIIARQAKTRIEPLPTRWSNTNESALRVEFLQGKWQGVAHNEPPEDWRGYESLVVDVVNPTSVPLKIMVRIDDQAHDWRDADRYNGRFEIAPETRERLRIKLSDIQQAPKDREFDLARVARILVFRQNDSEAPVMYLVRIGLEARTT